MMAYTCISDIGEADITVLFRYHCFADILHEDCHKSQKIGEHSEQPARGRNLGPFWINFSSKLAQTV